MKHDTDQSLPLSGVRVLDFSHVYQGPVATQLLADYGADVVKVERPGSGDWSRAWGPFVKGVSLPFANLNRNKRSVAIDMKSDEGWEIVRRLVAEADVLVHNFRGGVMEKLGFGYDAMAALNPRLVYAASSGWGDEGPYADRKRGGHDMMARAEAGWFIDQGPDRAPIPGGISVDYPAGLMLTIGILTALHHRQRTGRGQRVTTDLLSVAMHAHAWEAASELNASRIDEPARVGGTEAAINKAFLTADGAIEVSPVFSDNALRDICLGLGMEDLSLRPEFATQPLQVENADSLNALLGERFKSQTTDQWIARLEPAGVLCARVNTFLEAAEDPQVQANGMIAEVPHADADSLRVLGTPVRLHATPPGEHRQPPDLGADSRQVLAELGFDDDTLDRLQAHGVIGSGSPAPAPVV
ncbi:MAG: CaiB/BaiF CoA-transferase family protein [Planctomycetota bacterium]